METFPQVIGGGEPEMADLVQRLDPRRPGAALGHHQRPDRFHVAVARLRSPKRTTGLRRSRGLHRIDRVALAGPSTQLAVGAINLDHLDTSSTQMPG